MKLPSRNNDMNMKSKSLRSLKLLACHKLKVAEARVKTSEVQKKDADVNYAKMFESMAQTEWDLHVRNM